MEHVACQAWHAEMLGYVYLSGGKSGRCVPQTIARCLSAVHEHLIHACINCHKHCTNVCIGQCFTKLVTVQACFYTCLLEGPAYQHPQLLIPGVDSLLPFDVSPIVVCQSYTNGVTVLFTAQHVLLLLVCSHHNVFAEADLSVLPASWRNISSMSSADTKPSPSLSYTLKIKWTLSSTAARLLNADRR